MLAWAQELREGRGFLILRGFPVDRYALEDLVLMYAGLGSNWGTVVSQSVMGDRVGHVIAVEKLLHGERKRSYKGTHEMQLHNDFCDILGMFTVRRSEQGGLSRYASGVTVHNEILRTRPDLLPTLYRGFHYWRLGENPDQPVTPHRVPVFSSCDSVLSMNYQEIWDFVKPENTGVPLSELELEARAYLEEVSERPDIRLELMLESGECALLNNLVIMHSRSAVHNDSTDHKLRRHMMRLWVDCPSDFRRAIPELRIYEHGIGITHSELLYTK